MANHFQPDDRKDANPSDEDLAVEAERPGLMNNPGPLLQHFRGWCKEAPCPMYDSVGFVKALFSGLWP
jgi:hypothetical protein